MKCVCDNKHWQTFGLFALRLGVGLVFVVHGWAKLNGIDATSSFFDSAGIPLPEFFAYVVGLLEFLGGIAIILGVYVKTFAMLLAVEMLLALLLVHLGKPWAMAELAVVLFGASLFLSGSGAGEWRLTKNECLCKGKMGWLKK